MVELGIKTMLHADTKNGLKTGDRLVASLIQFLRVALAPHRKATGRHRRRTA
jgi:hypothetical protein